MITLPPSQAGVWAYCSGSPTMALTAPRLPMTQERREGVAAHWVASRLLKDWMDDRSAHYESAQDPDRTTITREMVEAAQVLLDDVELAYMESTDAARHIQVDAHGVARSVSAVNAGEIDVFMWEPIQRRLTIWEYKYGHRAVNPETSLQLANYILLALEILDVPERDAERVWVRLRVCQPRCFTATGGPVREWSGQVVEQRAAINLLRNGAAAAEGDTPVCRSGPHCVGCESRLSCPAAAKSAFAAFEYAGQPVPEVLTTASLCFEARVLKMATDAVKARMSAIEMEMDSRALKGEALPGFKVVFGKSPRKFSATPEDIDALGALFNAKLVESAPVSPAEAERRLKAAGVPNAGDVLAGYVTSATTGPRIVPDDGLDAVKAFGGK